MWGGVCQGKGGFRPDGVLLGRCVPCGVLWGGWWDPSHTRCLHTDQIKRLSPHPPPTFSNTTTQTHQNNPPPRPPPATQPPDHSITLTTLTTLTRHGHVGEQGADVGPQDAGQRGDVRGARRGRQGPGLLGERVSGGWCLVFEWWLDGFVAAWCLSGGVCVVVVGGGGKMD